MVTSSLSFDRAADFYDRTRADPLWVQQAISDSLIRESGATSQSRLLEIGIGTGRIAVPLAERGYHVYGFDLSLRMMEKLRENVQVPADSVRLVRADAAALPFPDNAFDIAFAVHVFHVVADWRRAIREARGVLRPGGTLLVSYHYRSADSANRVLRTKLRELAQENGLDTRRPGVQSTDEMLEELGKWGKPRIVSVAEWTETTTPETVLDEIQNRITSDTWVIPNDLLARFVPTLRAWALSEFGDLTRPETQQSRFDWMIVQK